MSKSLPFLLLTCVFTFAILFNTPNPGRADETSDQARIAQVEAILQSLVKALLADDYAAFLAAGSKELAKQISEDRFAVLRGDAIPILKRGYTVSHDVEVPEADGSVSHYWKVVPRNGEGELLAILVLKGGRVVDFQIQ